MCDTLKFRAICEKDLHSIIHLHEQFFPIRYTEDFYGNAVKGIGLCGGQLFTIIVENEREEIIGFLLAQLVMLDKTNGDVSFEPGFIKSFDALYILTIGVLRHYRCLKIGSRLLEMSIEHAKQHCSVVCLHVIEYNSIGRKFYERNSFACSQRIKDFYYIRDCVHLDEQNCDDKMDLFASSVGYHDAYLYEYKIPHAGLFYQFWDFFGVFQTTLSFVAQFIGRYSWNDVPASQVNTTSSSNVVQREFNV